MEWFPERRMIHGHVTELSDFLDSLRISFEAIFENVPLNILIDGQ